MATNHVVDGWSKRGANIGSETCVCIYVQSPGFSLHAAWVSPEISSTQQLVSGVSLGGFFVFSGGKGREKQVGFEKINPRIFFLKEKHVWKKTWKKRKRMDGGCMCYPPTTQGFVFENFPTGASWIGEQKSGKCWSRTGGP